MSLTNHYKRLMKTFTLPEFDENLEKPKYFFKILAITVFEFILIILLLPVTYETNDDFVMNSIVSGSDSGTPSEFIMFSNVIIGKILKSFYLILPNLNWYTLYVFSSLILSYSAIQFLFYKMKTNITVKIIRHLFILAALLYTFHYPGFTRVAGIVTFSGFLVLILSKANNYRGIALGVFLIVWGSMIRVNVLYMYIVMSLPFIIILLLKQKYIKLLYIFIAVTLAFAAKYYNDYVYKVNPEFYEYKVNNGFRSRLYTTNNLYMSYDKEKFDKIGWSIYDFKLAAKGLSDIGYKKFSNEVIKDIAQRRSLLQKLRNGNLYVKFKETIKTLYKFFEDQYLFFLPFFIIALLLLFYRRYELASVFVYFLYTISVLFVLYFFLEGALKDRVLFGIWLPVIFLALFWFDEKGSLPNNVGLVGSGSFDITRILLLNIAVLTVGIMVYSYNENSENRYKHRDRVHHYFDYLEKSEDDFYMLQIYFNPYYIYKNPPDFSKAYRLGWFIGYPSNRDRIEKYTGNRDAGIYTIFNKDIHWYFDPYFYSRLSGIVKDFYTSNYENCKVSRKIINLPNGDRLFKYTFHITKLDVSPLSTLGVELRFGEHYKISKLAVKGSSLTYRPEIPEELQIPEKPKEDNEE